MPTLFVFKNLTADKLQKKVFKQYPYRYINNKQSNSENKVLQAIYSKYPIINKGFINFPNSGNNAIFSDILIHKDTA